ncbi:hypothetical protein SLA2020_501280 [Shorea laevis]
MAILRHRHRRHSFTAIAFLLFASASVITLSLLDSGFHFQEKENNSAALDRILTQKRLIGPGSWPPSCRSRCGNCSPCKPVHVPIHPGVSFPLEYYPEAWRCKCGNKLFMP